MAKRLLTRLPQTQFRDDVLGNITIQHTIHPRVRYPWEAIRYNVWSRDGLCGCVQKEGHKWAAFPTATDSIKTLHHTRRAAARYLADVRRDWVTNWSEGTPSIGERA